MIYVYLMGGLGNQMFQIATGLSEALEHNTQAYFSKKTNLHISATSRPDYKDTILEFLPRMEEPNLPVFNERRFTYKKLENIINKKLRGYFQSEKYFIKHKNEVIKFFKTCLLREDVQNKINNILNKINTTNTISVHVRRNDYIHLQHVHYLQGETYYKNALTKLSKILDLTTYKLVIFSDDIKWCKKCQIFKKNKCYFVENNEDYIDLYLMSMCKHHIIANSSFSWWGAFLNENENKFVVAPSKWFGPQGPKKWDTIYCSNWLIANSIDK